MKVRCAKSGITFKCDYFPSYLKNGDISHPIFQIPLQDLYNYFPRVCSGQFTEIDSYLYFLALLDASDRIIWNSNAILGPKTPAIVHNNLEALARTIGKLNIISNHSFNPPKISLNKENADLRNVSNWIEVWDNYLELWERGQATARERERMKDIEARILSLVRTQSLYKKVRYAQALANWAAQAGSFPTFTIEHPFTLKPVRLDDYWKEIIIQAVNAKEIEHYPASDIIELFEHCIANIPKTSELAHTLFAALKKGEETNLSLLDADSEWHAPTKTFTILGASPREEAIKQQILFDAPKIMPKAEDYPTTHAFIKAKLLFNTAQRMRTQQGDS